MKSCRRRDLESIVGSLNHACKAARPGRAFKRRLHDLLVTVDRDGRRVRQNREARADIEWWHQFGLSWNGTSFMKMMVEPTIPQEMMLSDASGGWGCGAVWKGRWFQLSWETACAAKGWTIMPKELLPIVVAAAVWSRHWRGKVVKARCDNMAVVATIQSGACKEKWAMHLMRCLAFIEATVPMTVVAEHMKGVDNVVADALSRDRRNVACSLMQDAEAEPVGVSKELMDLLLKEDHCWKEQDWDRLRSICSGRV